mmetsp:Transcript_64327/g.178087  ORF Transcript_64327/g.178087 Transcript_64327/m.178087 type:complete len:176 (+) Transcript_64327:167-694(+)
MRRRSRYDIASVEQMGANICLAPAPLLANVVGLPLSTTQPALSEPWLIPLVNTHDTSPTLLEKTMVNLSKDYNERVQEEDTKTAEELMIRCEWVVPFGTGQGWVLPRVRCRVWMPVLRDCFGTCPHMASPHLTLACLLSNVGKVDPKRHLEQHVSDLMSANIVQSLGTMLNTVVF